MNRSQMQSLNKKLGPYLLLEKLGQGGMGVVYKAKHLELEQIVALKIIRPPQLKESDTLLRFHREARLASRLQHPNIVRTLDSGELNGIQFLVMEYIEGTPLSEHLATLSLQEGLTVFVKILQALHYAHQEGIIHRDLKPANIFMSAQGEPKIGDFGLAREVSSTDFSPLTQTGEILGTPSYMAPEQVTGAIDLLKPATDIYAVGICLYQFLTGGYPFEGKTVHELFYKITVEDPAPPSAHRREISTDLDLLTLKALEKTQGQRYATAQEFAEVLQQFLRGEPLFSKQQSLLIQMKRRFKKHRLKVVTGVLLVFSLVLFTFIQQKIIMQQNLQAKKFFLKKAETYLKQNPSGQISKDAQANRIQNLLRAFPYLKKAYLLFPENSDLKKQTLAVGKEIIAHTSVNGEYEISRYLLQSMQQEKYFLQEILQLESIVLQGQKEQHEKEQKILEDFEESLIQLKQHSENKELQQETLFWIARNATFISKKMLLHLEESFLYFKKEKYSKRDLKLEAFYLTLLHAGSFTAEPHYLPFLERALTVFQHDLFDPTKRVQFSAFEFDYGYYLYASLIKADPLHSFDWIHSFCQKLGEERHFFRRRLMDLRRKALQKKMEQNTLAEKTLKSFKQQAMECSILKEYQEAIRLYSLAIQENPDDSYLYCLRGLAYKELQNFEAAIENLNRAIQIQPNALYYSTRGNIFEILGEINKAKSDFNEAVRLDPKKSEHYIELARIASLENHLEGASFFCNQALVQNPQDAVAFGFRGKIRGRQKEYSSALLDFNQAIYFDPHNALFYLNRAHIQMNLGHLDESLKDYQQAIFLNPQYDLAYYSRGEIYRNKGEYMNALRDFNQAIYFDPTKHYYYQLRGIVYEALEKEEEALADYNQAIYLDPQSKAAYAQKNALLEKMRRAKKK